MTSTATSLRTANDPAAWRILYRLLQHYPGTLTVRLWDQTQRTYCAQRSYGAGQVANEVTLTLQHPALLHQLVLQPNPLHLAQAYFDGTLDVSGDVYEVLRLKTHFEHLTLPWREQAHLLLDALSLGGLPLPTWDALGQTIANQARALGLIQGLGAKDAYQTTFKHRHTPQSDQAAIAFHYDVSNEFYGLWLDEARVYSCAYFHSPSDSLDQAQRNKLEHICRKLRLRPGQTLLDIGCGWGALICWAAQNHGVRAHGITLSHDQLSYAQERIAREGLQDRVSVALCDYRYLPKDARFDCVSSVGMFEHVGLAQLPRYNAEVHRLLKPGGLFLNHGITHDEDGWQRTLATEFINRYVFPDGELDRVSNIALGMERAGFEILDIEALRPHYAMTLRHWVQRLEAQREAALALVGERTYRVWRLYMAACALEFEAGGTGLHQILAAKPAQGRWPLPLTRQDLYEPVQG